MYSFFLITLPCRPFLSRVYAARLNSGMEHHHCCGIFVFAFVPKQISSYLCLLDLYLSSSAQFKGASCFCCCNIANFSINSCLNSCCKFSIKRHSFTHKEPVLTVVSTTSSTELSVVTCLLTCQVVDISSQKHLDVF